MFDGINSKITIESVLPNRQERMAILERLIRSAELAEAVSPDAWGATLFDEGFRLNVGQVEVFTLDPGSVRILLAANQVDPRLNGLSVDVISYASVPAPQSVFRGTAAEYIVAKSILDPLHELFVRRAATTISGAPRKGTPHRASHSSELIEYAATEVSRGDRSRVDKQLGMEKVASGIPFSTGHVYHRKSQIHGVFGGQERGGICTPSEAPLVFIFSGESGTKYGYHDGWRPDGTYSYSGEGQLGDQDFVRGNRAIRDHRADGRDILLFEATPQKGFYRHQGCFSCAGYEFRVVPDKDGNNRRVIVFHLTPEHLDAIGSDYATEEPLVALSELRNQAYAAASTIAAISGSSIRTYYERSAVVRQYVLSRANGVCEACSAPAPFSRLDGSPYLEPHHTRRVSDGGPDHPKWVGAICPNCHRRVHHGADGEEFNRRLEQRLAELEAGDLA